MKTIYATNELEELVKFTINDEILLRIKHLQAKLKEFILLPLLPHEFIKITFLIDDELLVSSTEPNESAKVTITPNNVSISILGWMGDYNITTNILDCPDIFITDNFRRLADSTIKNKMPKEHQDMI